MAYLGNNNLPFDPTRTAAQPRDAERFSGNGSTTNFTLSRTPPNGAVDVTVYVENVAQEPITAYDVVGNSLNFTEAPPSGTYNIYVIYRNFQSGAQIIMPDGSVSYSKLANNLRLFTTDNLTPNGNNSVFTLSEPPADANTVFVTVDGMVQRAPVHYTTSGSTITFTSAPPVGSNVHVRHLGFRTTQTVTAISANTFIPQPNITSPTIAGTSTIVGDITITGNASINVTGQTYISNTNSSGSRPFTVDGFYNKFDLNNGFNTLESYHGTRIVLDRGNNYSDREFSIGHGASLFNGGTPTDLLSVNQTRMLIKKGSLRSAGLPMAGSASSQTSNIQVWTGTKGSTTNGTGFSLFYINNIYDNLSYQLYTFINAGGYFSCYHYGTFGYNDYSSPAGVGRTGAVTRSSTGALYNETMTITNNLGSTINEYNFCLVVWGLGTFSSPTTGGSDLIVSSYLSRRM